MTRFWRLYKIDVVVAAVFTAITQYEIWIGPAPIFNEPVTGSHLVLSLVALAFTLPLAFTRALPIPPLVIVMAMWALPPPPGISLNLLAIFVAMLLVVYLAATSTSGRTAVAAAAIVVASQVVSDLAKEICRRISAHGSFSPWPGCWERRSASGSCAATSSHSRLPSWNGAETPTCRSPWSTRGHGSRASCTTWWPTASA